MGTKTYTYVISQMTPYFHFFSVAEKCDCHLLLTGYGQKGGMPELASLPAPSSTMDHHVTGHHLRGWPVNF